MQPTWATNRCQPPLNIRVVKQMPGPTNMQCRCYVCQHMQFGRSLFPFWLSFFGCWNLLLNCSTSSSHLSTFFFDDDDSKRRLFARLSKQQMIRLFDNVIVFAGIDSWNNNISERANMKMKNEYFSARLQHILCDSHIIANAHKLKTFRKPRAIPLMEHLLKSFNLSNKLNDH